MLELALNACAGITALAFVIYWLNEGRRLRAESGYTTPLPPFWARLIAYCVARVLVAFKVGRITRVSSGKALAEERRYIYVVAPNHQLFQDAIVLASMGKLRRWRFMIAMEEVRRFFLAPFYSTFGAIPVLRRDPKAGGAGTARDAANAILGSVKALSTDLKHSRRNGILSVLWLIAITAAAVWLGSFWIAVSFAVFTLLGLIGLMQQSKSHFLIFPQGRLVKDDILAEGDFQNGPVKIGRRLQKETGREVAVLPVHIRYHFDPSKRRFWEKLLDFVHFPRKFFGYGPVYGATVSVGDPIPISSLPAKDDAAMKIVYDTMVAMKAASAER